MDGVAGLHKADGRRAYPAAASRTTEFLASTWHAPKQRRVALAISAAILSALAFARVAEDYLTNDPLARWDVSFARWITGERSTVGTDFFRVLTFFGSPAVALAISAIVFVVLYRRRHLVDAALLPVVLGGAELLNLILKLSFHRTRPEVASVNLETYFVPERPCDDGDRVLSGRLSIWRGPTSALDASVSCWRSSRLSSSP